MIKKILLILTLCCWVQSTQAQIQTDTIQGINCNNDTGYIFLTLDAASSVWIWEYDSAGTWVNVSSLGSAVTLSVNNDSLFSTVGGDFRLNLWVPATGIDTSNTFRISPPITMGIGTTLPNCFGDSSGEIRRPTFGGEKFDPDSSIVQNDTLSGDEYYIYQWFSADDGLGTNSVLFPDTTQNLSGIPSGWYQTIVTDAIGCTDTSDWVELPDRQLFEVDTLVVKGIICNGNATGSIELSVVGGQKFQDSVKYFYYLVLNGDTVRYSDSSAVSSGVTIDTSITGTTLNNWHPDSVLFADLKAGSYNLLINDSLGCLIDTVITINEPIYTLHISPDTILCSSDSTWLVIDSITGGNDSIYYGWETTNFDDSLYAVSGTHNVVVVDTTNQCMDTLPYFVAAKHEIEVFTRKINNLCFGDSLGEIIIDSIQGGTAPYSFQWINAFGFSSTDSTISNLIATDYILQIIDFNGCILIDTITITQADEIISNSMTYAPLCHGDANGSIKINPEGGSGNLTISWSNGLGASDSLSSLSSGVYVVTITDTNSCSTIDSIVLNEPDSLQISLEDYTENLSCFGALTSINAVVSGGTGPFVFSWSHDSTNINTNVIVGTGSYFCTVTDINGCTTTSSTISISEPDSFVITDVSIAEPTCDIGGIAVVSTAGGTPPYTYLWSNGSTTDTAYDITTATAWVMVTDSCGVSLSDTITFTPYLLVTSSYYDNITHIASVEVETASTGGPYSYQWANIIDIANIIATDSMTSNLCEGTYIATTTDELNGCTKIDTIVATFYLPVGIVDVSTTTVLPDSNLWGFGPYTYLWDSGENTQHANICPGDHWVEVTDIDGCMVKEDITIAPIDLVLTPAEAIVECNLENLDVELEVTASGGTSPYTYLWSNGATANPLNLALNPGKYTVTVMDNNACTTDTSFRIASVSSDCIPNVFTPNGDNVNDTWNLEDSYLFDDVVVKIYGRFGKKMFESVGYDVPWDGKNKKGNPVPDGTYFYHIELGNGFDPIKGTLTIIR